jgi:hypothetical protein
MTSAMGVAMVCTGMVPLGCEESAMNKAERRNLAVEATVEKAWREAKAEDMKREWVARAAREDRCPACGNAPAARCRDEGRCCPAIAADLARRRATTTNTWRA